jgi:Domain of Unknown Function (DUF928)
MKTSHRLQQVAENFRLATTILLVAILTTTAFPAIAKTPSPNLKIRWKPPIPPSSLGIPGNRAQGGGTRGCQPYRGITALVPKLPQNIAWGQTIGDRPTVWLNTPQGLAKDLQMEIAVREQNGNPIAKQLFTTKSKVSSGAIGIAFPPATVLKIDRTYHWAVAFYCDTDERVDSPLLVQGQIQRIAAPAAFTTAKSPLERTQILAANGIWYDALTQLGDRFRQTKDREILTAWAALLRSAGISGGDSLSETLRERIQDCCQ